MYESLQQLQQETSSIFTEGKIIDQKKLQDETIDTLVYTAVFSEDTTLKTEARKTIRELAEASGAHSDSIINLYLGIGKGNIQQTFTVPAINVRFLTYDTSRIIFRLMKQQMVGPVVFEIARSEIEYTDQRPDEFTVAVLAAAIKEGYVGPVYVQADHVQFSARRYGEDKETETNKIKALIKECIEANFLNIDIDASTLVDLQKPTQDEQQAENYKVTAMLTDYIRSLQPQGVDISIGAEIGHIGGKNSTPEELQAFMDGYTKLVSGKTGISKISVQTGSSHGGIPLPDGTIADVKIDFNVLEQTGKVAREQYHIGGVVQHGASTLPNDLFHQFPQHKTLEIHLATGFQNIVYDTMPTAIKEQMYTWLDQNHQPEWNDTLTHEQNIYKTRKRAIGPFKKQLWMLPLEEKQLIMDGLEKQLSFLFEQLHIANTKSVLAK